MRKALQPLLDEQPKEIAIAVFGSAEERRLAAEAAIYAALVNGAALPQRKKKDERRPLQKIALYGYQRRRRLRRAARAGRGQ